MPNHFLVSLQECRRLNLPFRSIFFSMFSLRSSRRKKISSIKVLAARCATCCATAIKLGTRTNFFMLGTENRWCQLPNQENVEGDQPVQSHSHAQQPLQPQTRVQEHCPGKTKEVLGKYLLGKTGLQAVHEMSLVLLFKVMNCLSSVDLSRRKQCCYYREWFNLMHAKFHCCGTTPSWSAYEFFSPRLYTNLERLCCLATSYTCKNLQHQSERPHYFMYLVMFILS